MANPARRPGGPICGLSEGAAADCDDDPPGVWVRQAHSAASVRRGTSRGGSKWPRRKIGMRRGQGKWCSRAELERRSEADRPIRLVVGAIQRLRDVEAQDYESQEVQANRAAVTAQHRPDDQGVIGRVLAPLHLVARLPGD